MEYYSGVLFLTTNRVGDFDEAFSSRIHISLYYPELDAGKTAEVFKINMDMIEDCFILNGRQIDIDKDGIGKFASQFYEENPEARWNGRQIRNACQTALALAEYETLERLSRDENQAPAGQIVHLRIKHFEKVRDAYLDFANYVKDIYGTGARRRAKEAHLRASWDSDHDERLGNRMPDRRRQELQRASRPLAQIQMGQQPQVPQVHLQQGQPSMLAGGAGIYHPQPQQVQMQPQYQYAYPVAPAPAQQMMQQPQGSLGYGAPPQNQQAAGQAYQQQQPPFPNNTQQYLGNHAGTPQAPAGQGQFSQQPMQQLVPGTSLPPASAGFGPHVPATPMTPGSSFGQQMGSGSA